MYEAVALGARLAGITDAETLALFMLDLDDGQGTRTPKGEALAAFARKEADRIADGLDGMSEQ